nr:MAG TPA: hypothetical protein [Caudoviricetes sp.]
MTTESKRNSVAKKLRCSPVCIHSHMFFNSTFSH